VSLYFTRNGFLLSDARLAGRQRCKENFNRKGEKAARINDTKEESFAAVFGPHPSLQDCVCEKSGCVNNEVREDQEQKIVTFFAKTVSS
jgi:hypothetical protein